MSNCKGPDLDKNYKQSFEQIYKQYYWYVHRIFYKMTKNVEWSEDMTQEAFLRIYKYYHTFSPEKGSIKTWVRVVAQNLWIRYKNEYRRDSENLCFLNEQTYELSSTKQSHTQVVEGGILLEIVSEMMEKQPEPQRGYLRSRYLEEQKVTDIAKKHNISDSLMSRRISNAVLILRKEISMKKINIQ